MKITSLEDLFRISQEKLENQNGTINITFANRTHIYTGNDIIGNCLQEWLPNWFKHLGVNIQPGKGTQTFPDFIVCFDDKSYDMEIKAWNINNNPAFDLANFHSFIETTFNNPGKINAQYFILGYSPENDGFSQGFSIKKIFLKNIWEITSSTQKYPLTIQVKRGMPYAIRPYNFNKNPKQSFKSKEKFIDAVKHAFDLFPSKSLNFTSDDWYYKVSKY